MTGSVGIAAALAILAFPALLLIAWARGNLAARGTAIYVALGLLVWQGLPRWFSGGDLYVTPALAVLDVSLAFTLYTDNSV